MGKEKFKCMEWKFSALAEEPGEVGVHPLDNKDLSVVIKGLNYQTDEDLQEKLNRMLSMMGQEAASLEILKCKGLNEGSSTRPGTVKLLSHLSMLKLHACHITKL